MGTRNLTMVINKEGETKVAQYGQWDGYPSGQGTTILSFLQAYDLDEFNEKLNVISFFNKKEEEELNNDPNWLTKYPWLTRDLGGEILKTIFNNKFVKKTFDPVTFDYHYSTIEVDIKKLINQTTFAGDGLFCEWAYVVDLSKGTFEVYEGFVKTPLDSTERFYYLQKEDSDYSPVKLVKEYKLSELPTGKEFLNDLEPNEEE